MTSANPDPAEAFKAAFAARAPGFRLRRAGPDDEAFLWTLFAATQAEALPLPPALLRMQFESQLRAYAEQWSGATDWIVQRREQPIGRFLLDFSSPDRIHGVDLAVLPDERQGAAGLMLLRAWVATCDRLRRIATLSVRPGAPAAAIYRRLGFVETEAYVAPVPMRREPRPCP